jgi:hypothetical protein
MGLAAPRELVSGAKREENDELSAFMGQLPQSREYETLAKRVYCPTRNTKEIRRKVRDLSCGTEKYRKEEKVA